MKKVFCLLVCTFLIISCEMFGLVEEEPRVCHLFIENKSHQDIIANIPRNDTFLDSHSMYIASGKKEKYYLGGGDNFEENFRMSVKGDTLHVLLYTESVNLADWLLHKNDSLLLAHYRLTLGDVGRNNHTYTILFGNSNSK